MSEQTYWLENQVRITDGTGKVVEIGGAPALTVERHVLGQLPLRPGGHLRDSAPDSWDMATVRNWLEEQAADPALKGLVARGSMDQSPVDALMGILIERASA